MRAPLGSLLASGAIHLVALIALATCPVLSPLPLKKDIVVEFRADQISFEPSQIQTTASTGEQRVRKVQPARVPPKPEIKKEVTTFATVAETQARDEKTEEDVIADAATAEDQAKAEDILGGSAIANEPFTDAIIKNIMPVYPRIARLRGWTGKVLLRMRVDPAGNVQDVQIVKPSKYTVFNSSALKAASQWVFRESNSGKPYQVEKEVVFKLL